MSIFSKLFSGKGDNSRAAKRIIAEKVNNRLLKCVVSRENGVDTIIAKNGHISLKEDIITVYGEGRECFRGNIYEVNISELISLEGAIFVDMNRTDTIIAYYKYYRENL